MDSPTSISSHPSNPRWSPQHVHIHVESPGSSGCNLVVPTPEWLLVPGCYTPPSPLQSPFTPSPTLSPLSVDGYLDPDLFPAPTSPVPTNTHLDPGQLSETFPTLIDLLKTLLETTMMKRADRLCDAHLQLAVAWIMGRFQSVEDIPERDFSRYADSWRVVASKILKDHSKSGFPAAKIFGTMKGIPRPCNSFFVFKAVAVGTLHAGVASQIWRVLPRENVRVWELAADKLDQIHKEIFPGYRYQPKYDPRKERKPRKFKARPAQVESCTTIPDLAQVNEKAQEHMNENNADTTSSEDPGLFIVYSDRDDLWAWRNLDEDYGHNSVFPVLSGPGELTPEQDLQSTLFELEPDLSPQCFNDLGFGISSGDAQSTHTRDTQFDEGNWINEFNSLLWSNL